MPVEIVRRGAGKQFPSRRLKKVALTVLGLVEQENVELSLALVGNAEMQKLNAKYRRMNHPTDVLSFPMEEKLLQETRLLGDVIISVEQAAEQARERRRTLDEEMTTLLIHGIVHLLGYDHERSERQAKVMFALERKLHARLCERGLLRL